ncbi:MULTISPECIES: LysR family transcriptional regulator substrate-binding protein [Levilactobacillus]
MLPTIQKILSGKNDMMNEAMVSGQTAYEQVKIAYSNTMIKAIPEAFFKIAQTNVKSNLRLDIVQKATHQIIEEVKNEKLDAGFITINNPNLKQISQLKFDIVHTSKVKLTVNKNNPLCNQKSISLEQLAKQKFGLYTDEYNDQLFKQLQYLCGPLNVVLRTDSGWTMLKAISDMNIVCLGREWQGNNSPDMPDNSDVLIRQLDLGNIINDEFVVGWITRPDYRKSPLLGSLITQVNQNLRA